MSSYHQFAEVEKKLTPKQYMDLEKSRLERDRLSLQREEISLRETEASEVSSIKRNKAWAVACCIIVALSATAIVIGDHLNHITDNARQIQITKIKNR